MSLVRSVDRRKGPTLKPLSSSTLPSRIWCAALERYEKGSAALQSDADEV